MRISARELQLSSDLMELQQNYNRLLVANATLLSAQSVKEESLNKEILRLTELLKRVESLKPLGGAT